MGCSSSSSGGGGGGTHEPPPEHGEAAGAGGVGPRDIITIVDIDTEKRINRDVEKAIQQAKLVENAKVKLLLLGPGESGKSTIFRQMKILYGDGVSDKKRREMKSVVHQNIMGTIKRLVNQALFFGCDEKIKSPKSFDLIEHMREDDAVDEQAGEAIATLWEDPEIQHVWSRRAEFQVVESMKFFLDDVRRIAQPSYLPTDQDILHVRLRTTGIVVNTYVIGGVTFELYDVGGQRTERKKWIHCFDNVTAIIFVASLSDFDQSLYEDTSTNRMTEAIELFGEMCVSEYFIGKTMILFLNKKDLFAEKIATKDIASVSQWKDFTGNPGDFDAGVEYFREKFLMAQEDVRKEQRRSCVLNRMNAAAAAAAGGGGGGSSGSDGAAAGAGAAGGAVPGRTVYQHVTCATDTENVELVFKACRTTILMSQLTDNGFV